MGGGNISLAADMISNKDDGDQSLQPRSLAASYNDVIRPLCDSLHKLRCMNVIEEGITLPTIVVIGDQSSGLCIRVPLIIRLQPISDNVSIRLEFHGETIALLDDGTKILEEIDRAIVNIKEISNLPLTLIVRKNTIPGLTIIDLPGIAVNSQSDNINNKISGMDSYVLLLIKIKDLSPKEINYVFHKLSD
ncbi:putative dynamin-related protein 4A [Rutidosis leptorrhynchoides]|uniref:putative dynamin-related protein 4A n=1 Tax=Rutidosis leptorrhynchoides TaxID=125765 RepID=UPI003A9926BF